MWAKNHIISKKTEKDFAQSKIQRELEQSTEVSFMYIPEIYFRKEIITYTQLLPGLPIYAKCSRDWILFLEFCWWCVKFMKNEAINDNVAQQVDTIKKSECCVTHIWYIKYMKSKFLADSKSQLITKCVTSMKFYVIPIYLFKWSIFVFIPAFLRFYIRQKYAI